MDILVGCEESQEVTKAFRIRGHNAYSCDIQDCSGGHPEWHIKGDVREQIKKKWDMMILHPSCIRLCNSGVLRLYINGKKANGIDPIKWAEMVEAAEFFKMLLEADCPKIVIDNPIPHGHALKLIGRKYSQIIQPYNFGENASKSTCLWLKNAPPLIIHHIMHPSVLSTAFRVGLTNAIPAKIY